MWIAAGVGAVLGLIIGLLIGYVFMPVEWTNAAVTHLRPDLQQDYLAMAVQSYARNPNPGLAQRRWTEMGDSAQEVLNNVSANAAAYGLTAEDVNAFGTAVNATPAGGAPGQPGEQPAPAQPAGGFPTGLLVASCVLMLLIGGALAYLLLFRNRQPPLARGTKAAGAGSTPSPVMTYPEGQEPPIAQYLTTFTLGNDLYDDSFSIDSPTGEFLGECGVGISETIGVGDPKKVTAFEVWLFDKNDIQTVTKVLMSAHAFNDPTVSQRLASKGEPVLADPGKRMVLETATLQLEARVVNMNYGQGALPQNSFFDQMTLELAIWPKSQ
jgi:hypothetical protein